MLRATPSPATAWAKNTNTQTHADPAGAVFSRAQKMRREDGCRTNSANLIIVDVALLFCMYLAKENPAEFSGDKKKQERPTCTTAQPMQHVWHAGVFR